MKQTYYTHDNGGRPFKVVVNNENNKVKVYEQLAYDETRNVEIYDDKPVYKVVAEEIFIGKSPKISMTDFSGGHGKEFNGNSILLKLPANDYTSYDEDTNEDANEDTDNLSDNNRYVFIGPEISEFTTQHPIIYFSSPVGNSDVPYPWAMDERSNFYLFSEDIILKPNSKLIDSLITQGEPYEYYYNWHLLTPDRSSIPAKPTEFKSGIKDYYSDGQRWTLTTEHPKDELKTKDPKSIYLLTDKNQWVNVTPKQLANIKRDFRNKLGFLDLDKQVIVERS